MQKGYLYNSIDLLFIFLIPIVLSLLFVPISRSFAVYLKYQELFIIMSFRGPENKRNKRRHRWEIMKECKLSYKLDESGEMDPLLNNLKVVYHLRLIINFNIKI